VCKNPPPPPAPYRSERGSKNQRFLLQALPEPPPEDTHPLVTPTRTQTALRTDAGRQTQRGEGRGEANGL